MYNREPVGKYFVQLCTTVCIPPSFYHEGIGSFGRLR
jgi:hypothetical protein